MLKIIREKVTAIHKANIMKMSDGLFLDVFREVASKHGVEYDDLIVDASYELSFKSRKL